jgi:predicted permease
MCSGHRLFSSQGIEGLFSGSCGMFVARPTFFSCDGPYWGDVPFIEEQSMTILETLAPLVILIGLGALLAHLKFLGEIFVADLNKLAFWIALPALLFRSAAAAGHPGARTFHLLGILVAATLLACLASYLLCSLLRVPVQSRGTLAQSAFRGNLAYIGIPLLSLGLPAIGGGPEAFPTAVVVMTLMMVLFNFLAVLVLQQGQWKPREAAWSIVTNPLLVAGLLGLAWSTTGLGLTPIVDKTLQILGSAAVPIALLCIGGTLVAASPGGRTKELLIAVGLKIVFVPLVAWGLGLAIGLGRVDLRIAVVLAACPTAAASYVMAARMGGDAPLASAAIAVSTLCSSAALVWALWVTG